MSNLRRQILAQARHELRTLGYIRTATIALIEAMGIDVATIETYLQETL